MTLVSRADARKQAGIVGFGQSEICAIAVPSYRQGAPQPLQAFWVAPIVGAALAGFTYKALFETDRAEPPVTGRIT
jgi:hypothetical protein